MESLSDPDGRRESARLPERRTGGEQHHAGELLGARQTHLSERPDRTSESRQHLVVQKYLHSRAAPGRNSENVSAVYETKRFPKKHCPYRRRRLDRNVRVCQTAQAFAE